MMMMTMMMMENENSSLLRPYQEPVNKVTLAFFSAVPVKHIAFMEN